MNKNIFFSLILVFILGLVAGYCFTSRYKIYCCHSLCLKIDRLTGRTWRYKHPGFVECQAVKPSQKTESAGQIDLSSYSTEELLRMRDGMKEQ